MNNCKECTLSYIKAKKKEKEDKEINLGETVESSPIEEPINEDIIILGKDE